MPRNGSGTFTRVHDWTTDKANTIKITASRMDADADDMATALTGSLAADGQTNPTANLPMATYRHTGVGAAQARTDYARADQVQDGSIAWCGTAGGTADALTLTPTPAITAYAAGQVFRFVAASDNTASAVTVNVSGVGAANIDATLDAGQIESGRVYELFYDGSNFQITPRVPEHSIYTRAQALAMDIPSHQDVLHVFHGGVLCAYVRDASGTALTSGDGQKWSPAGGDATPAHWGGEPGSSNDATTAVQACFTWVGAQYDTGVGTFDAWVNLAMQVWRCTSAIDSTNVRQPNMRFGNGGLFFDMTGGYGLEMFGVNSAIIVEPFYIETPEDSTACPEFAFSFGRCEDGGVAAPIAPSMKGTIYVDGACSKASILNLGSEVSGLTPFVHNSHPDSTAYCYFGSGHMQDADDIWGAELSSSFCTLPPASGGAFSNILHDLQSGELKRDADWNVTITGITQANPAVVSFSSTATNSAKIANGQTVYISDGGGMNELDARSFTVAGLSVAGDGLSGSFQLSGEDSTGHTAYSTGGGAWRGTGPAICIGVSASVNIGPAAYLLTYGAPAAFLHCQNGTAAQFSFRGQTENQVPNPVEIDVGSGSVAIQGMTLDLLSASQVIAAPLKLTGAGTLSIRDLNLTVNSQAAAFADELCTNGANLSVRNAKIQVPNPLDVSGLSAFAGFVWVQNPEEVRWYANKSNYLEASSGDFTWNSEYLAVSDGTTGGSASAGSGNQYVELNINGTTYKVLHDGTV